MIVNCLDCKEYEFISEKQRVCWFRGIVMQFPFFVNKEINQFDKFGNRICNYESESKKKGLDKWIK